MLKKNKYFVVGIILIISLVIIAVAASGTNNSTSKWKNFGFSYQKVYNDVDKNKVIAKLDGEAITKQEFDGTKVFLTALYDREPSSQEVMEKVLNEKVILIEAKKRNLYPDRAETLEYMAMIKNNKEQAINEGIEIDEESAKSWEETLEGQGLTEEEYWKSEDTIKGYQAALATARVRSKLVQEWGFSGKEMSTPAGAAKFEEKLNNMIDEQKNKLNLEYVEPIISN